MENVANPSAHRSHDVDAHIVPLEQEAYEDVTHINLTWRSWLVVFITAWA